LKDWPSVVKAIIMASAVHNIEGDSRLSDKDGAGGIDAALADQIALTQGGTGTCNTPCWWNITTNTSTPSLSNSLERTFRANQGERVRVVISWLSQADSNGTTDSLLTNYHLYIRRSDTNAIIASSTSSSNNFEIVDFAAPVSGQYKLQVYRSSSGDNNEASNYLGIAWIKDATYLPDVRRNSGGQTSNVYIRNNGSLARNTTVTFYNQNGTFNSAQSNSLSSKALWVVLPPNNWQGAAIIDGGEDVVAVVVRNDGTGISALDTGFVDGGSGDIAFETAASTLYAPAVYNNIFGGFNTTFYLQNASAVSNYVTLTFYGRAGYGDYATGITLAGGGSGTVTTGSVMGSTAWAGSVRITASAGSVAAKIYEGQGSTVSRTFSAVAGGKSLLYIPAAYKNMWNLTSGLVIQNLHPSNATNVTVTYCDRDFLVCSSEPTFSINAQRAAGINVGASTALPASWTGSIKIQSTGGTPLGVALTNSSITSFFGGYDFNGTNFGSKVVTLPSAAKNAGGRTTGYTLRNVSGQNNVTVYARYYDTSGNLTWSRTITSINSGQVKGFAQSGDTLPNGWEGSIVLEATADIIAIMREDTTATLGGYNGIPR
jgi:hypothetical protein